MARKLYRRRQLRFTSFSWEKPGDVLVHDIVLALVGGRARSAVTGAASR
ncbi:hypothetical protein ACTVZO_42630 [Streptomyces sp. IBSNAI002]